MTRMRSFPFRHLIDPWYLSGKLHLSHLKEITLCAEETEEDIRMAATTTPDLMAARAVLPVAAPKPRLLHRQIDPQAGRALEKLGHAIEYLTDEYVHSGGSLAADDPRLQAVQLLMAINREIYFFCPAIPGPVERIRAWLRMRGA